MAPQTKLAAALPFILAVVSAQQIGTMIPEVHPKLLTQRCTLGGGCNTVETTLVTDALARPLHEVDNPEVACDVTNKEQFPDAETGSKNCALEGIDYESIGVTTEGAALTLKLFMPQANGTLKTVSPRVYLLGADEQNYEMLRLVNQELTYDVDMSKAQCGVNGALYLSEMEESGARSEANRAGAAYGTGYCDAQCFNTTFINGLANLDNAGSCCNEMDIWEANSRATVMTPHTCSGEGLFLCNSPEECARGTGVCDKSGCGVNPFAQGARSFYGPGRTVDTTRPFTVVTQFISADNTSTGELAEIRRVYIQEGRSVTTATVLNETVDALETGIGAVTQDFCVGKNTTDFLRLGGLAGMGESLARGMVLIFSIWNSPGDFMEWLDQAPAGPCNATEGDPLNIQKNQPDASVVFSNIRWGDIGSTVRMMSNGTVVQAALAEFSDAPAPIRGAGVAWVALVVAFGYLFL